MKKSFLFFGLLVFSGLFCQTSFEQNRTIEWADYYFINENYANQSLNMIRGNLLHAMEETRESMNQAMQDIITTAQVAIDGADNLGEEFMCRWFSLHLDDDKCEM